MRTEQAERTIYRAADRLDKSLTTLAALRALIKGPLPLAGAEALMDDIEDHLDAIGGKLGAALTIHESEMDRIEAIEPIAANDATPIREAA